ncbi:MAG: leucine--tRNA ligase [Candidatus Berkelbacteria bacterium]|nr:leucine--tRNA ligase [Candidatus Berkelbacteria bacterium]
MPKYNPSKIETKWQKIWEKNSSVWQAKDFSKKKKFYTLFEFPYPSGEGLHMGHLRGQTATDIFARKKRLQGYNVLNPIGWDAFGLPTENYAIKNKIHPADATRKNIASMKAQEKMLGYFLDWPREINTTDPKYYKWTQWIFLQLFKHGLAYKKDIPINWCLSCKIGLANEEIIDGRCERCGGETTKKNVSQWLLRITKYADKLIEGLKDLDFPERVKTSQTSWIGRSNGADIDFSVKDTKHKIRVFTTRPDTLFGATFMVIAPEHDIILNLKKKISNFKSVEGYIKKAKTKSDLERTELTKIKTGIKLEGVRAINPVNNEEIPIFVADYVLSSYGTGAIMAVPAHDQRDFEFAKQFNLPVSTVIQPSELIACAFYKIKPKYLFNRKQLEPESELTEAARLSGKYKGDVYTGTGVLINSGDYNGKRSSDAAKEIVTDLEKKSAGKFAINYKLRDWIFSRQHYWGEPIPIVYCGKCSVVPVPENELPVLLPEVKNYEPTDTGESPLAKITDWVNTKCPKCNGPAKRETDTMPNWAGSSWYFLRYIDPGNDKELADKEKLKYWMPVDLYEGGMEHTTLHLLYSRFWNEFLYDIGVIPTSEPYKKRVPHGIILAHDSRKMSKSFGNIVSPDEMVKEYGADTTRTYAMFIGPFDQSIAWDKNGLKGVWRFLNKVWDNMSKPNGNDNLLEEEKQSLIIGVSKDIESFSMNTAIAKLMEFNNLLTQKNSISFEIKTIFLTLLYPFAPHISEELWQSLRNKKFLFESTWPKAEKDVKQKYNYVIQINGRKKFVIKDDFDLNEKDMIEKVLKIDKISKELKDGYKKAVFVKGKIVNFVI